MFLCFYEGQTSSGGCLHRHRGSGNSMLGHPSPDSKSYLCYMSSERALFLRHLAQTSDAPLMLEIDRGEGVWLYGRDGEKWLDLIAGISVSNLGHGHPAVVEAVQEQAARYMHTLVYGELVMSPQVQLAATLTSLLPKVLSSVYFTNSGTEATEGAMKLAKRYTGRSEIISCYNAYHGSTQGALSLMGDEYWRNAFRPLLPGIRQIRYNAVEDLKYITSATAAVVIDPVQAESGVTVPDRVYFQLLRERCTATGTLLILDEIQTGMGRTGSLFAFEQLGIVPDILLLAKGFGGGMPLGAFISSAEIMGSLMSQPVLGHITTFGGHPVCCAAALAALNVLSNSNLMADVPKKEALFISLLQHPAIRKVTHQGLLMAVHLEDDQALRRVIQYCLAHGVLTDWFLFAPNCLRIAPPLIISEAEIRLACQVILEALDSL
jgi:acetylornithine/N-succinyldiaminopimelate aminotransferase